MELSPEELKHLAEDQEVLELRQGPAFTTFLNRLKAAVDRLEKSLLETKLTDFDQYLSFWYQRQALLSVIGEVDAADREAAALLTKAAEQPDNRPATGDLA